LIIGYFYAGFPGEMGELKQFSSLSSAKAEFREFSRMPWVVDGSVSGSLYCGMSEEDWEEAKEYENIGNPFDYPSYILELGPRGGVKLTPA
jgi:hypothetical protein